MKMEHELESPKYIVGQPLYHSHPVYAVGFSVRAIKEPEAMEALWGLSWVYTCVDEWGNKREIFESNLKTLPGLKNSIKKYLKVVK